MKNKVFYLVIFIIGLFLSSSCLFAEFIFTNDGMIYEGTIVSDKSNAIVLRKKSDGKRMRINQNNVMRVLYTNLYMGKIYVVKSYGKTVSCYMVDEDRDSYTFRKELYKPEEFKIPREDVLFIARGNPSRLKVKGESQSDKVFLEWHPPYPKTISYNIYIRKDGEKEFKLYGISKKRNAVILNLQPSTRYFAKVTAVNMQQEESESSNEIKFTTSNSAPSSPKKAILKNISSSKKEPQYQVSWNQSVDVDGDVIAYRIYINDENGLKLVDEIKNSNPKDDMKYTFNKGTIGNNIYISAVDNKNSESDKLKIYVGKRKEFDLAASMIGVFPLGELQHLSDAGVGLNMRADFSNFLFNHFELGLNFQNVFFLPKEEYNEKYNDINNFSITTLSLYTGWSFYFLGKIRVMPLVHGGGTLLYLDYDHFVLSSSNVENEKQIMIRPIASVEIATRYDYSENIFFESSFSATCIFGNEENYYYLGILLGAGYRF